MRAPAAVDPYPYTRFLAELRDQLASFIRLHENCYPAEVQALCDEMRGWHLRVDEEIAQARRAQMRAQLEVR